MHFLPMIVAENPLWNLHSNKGEELQTKWCEKHAISGSETYRKTYGKKKLSSILPGKVLAYQFWRAVYKPGNLFLLLFF